MSKIPDENISDVLHIELCSAINDLAKSVEVAVTRIKLRAECNAAITDAEKAEKAAATLRFITASSDETPEQCEVALVPELKFHKAAQESSYIANVSDLDAIDTIRAACTWLRENQSKTGSNAECNGDSAIALRIVELQDRLRDHGQS